MKWDIEEEDINGLRVYSICAPEAERTTLCTRFHVGSLDEYPRFKRGVKHFFEHVPFKVGSLNFRGNAFIHAARLLADLSACITLNDTKFAITLPRENFGEGCNLLSDVILRADLLPELVRLEGLAIAAEHRETPFLYPLSLDSFEKAQLLVGNHPAFVPILGTEEDILAITNEDMEQCGKEFDVRENCRILVRGNHGHDEMFRQVESSFADLPHGVPVKKIKFTFPGGFHLMPLPRVSAVKCSVVYPCADRTNAPMDAWAHKMLNGYFQEPTGPVMVDLRDEQGMVYGVYPEAHFVRGFSYNEFGIISPRNEVDRYLGELIGHMRDVVEGEIGDEWFLMQKAMMRSRYHSCRAEQRSPGIGELIGQIEQFRRLVPPREEMQALEDLQLSDLVEHGREVMALPPTFFGHGNVTEMIARQRFDEMIAPVTAMARALKDHGIEEAHPS